MKTLVFLFMLLVSSLTPSLALAAKTYPPHGYPCLGCAPCPGSNPVEYCDLNNMQKIVWSPKWTAAKRDEAEARTDAQAQNTGNQGSPTPAGIKGGYDLKLNK